MNQLCFYPLALTASTLLAALAPASRPSLALWMLGALPVFFLYYARKRCKVCIAPSARTGTGMFLYHSGSQRRKPWYPAVGRCRLYDLFPLAAFSDGGLCFRSAASAVSRRNCLFVSFSAALSGKQRLGSLLSYESDPGVFIVCCHFVFAVL